MQFRCLAALPVLALLGRCGAGERIGESSPRPTMDLVNARLALAHVDSVALEQSAAAAGLAGFDLDRSGAIVLGDSSDGTVRLYAPDGRLRLTLGRKGSGFGEFTNPGFPRFRGDGTLHVADAANARVTVFGSDGMLLRSVQLRPLISLSGFVPLEDGRYLVTSDDPDGYVLFLFDSAGEVLDRFLPIRDDGSRGSPSPTLRRQFWLAQRGDSAFVVSTLSDSLWIVHLTDRGSSAIAITQPDDPRRLSVHDPHLSLHQLRGLEVATAVDAGPAGLIVNLRSGSADAGEPGTAVVLTPLGNWIALEHTPASLHSGTGAFATLAPVGDGTGLMLRRYRLITP